LGCPLITAVSKISKRDKRHKKKFSIFYPIFDTAIPLQEAIGFMTIMYANFSFVIITKPKILLYLILKTSADCVVYTLQNNIILGPSIVIHPSKRDLV
jgi:hypothetical protein